jgi:hypothetical protein
MLPAYAAGHQVAQLTGVPEAVAAVEREGGVVAVRLNLLFGVRTR